MKVRIISSLVGLLILAVVLIFIDTLVLNFTIGAICLIAVYEMLNATKCRRFKGLLTLSFAVTLVIPFARWRIIRPFLLHILFVLMLLFFILLIKNSATMGIKHVAIAFFFSTIIPLFFSCAVYVRDDYGSVAGGFYLLVALGSAWLCDTGAYFVGIKFGKRKLAPRVSPKKTVEGAVGGVVFASLIMLLLGYLYSLVMKQFGVVIEINYLLLGCCTPIFAVIGMLGDLSMSAIKREYGVKDYGNIMPGHGGILDRFDSVLFTLPTVYIVLHNLSFVSVIAG